MASVAAQPSRQQSSPGFIFSLAIRLRALFQTLLIPFLAIFTALVFGAILILLAGRDPIAAYEGLVEGALLEPRGLVQSLLKSSPLILSGLAVGFAFKGGLFNIGAQGQLIMGSVAAAWAGYAITGLPPWIHIPLAIAIGTAVGAFWGAIPGALKAYTEAHEVITTIMFNFIASRIAEWLISSGSQDGSIRPGPMNDPESTAIQRSPAIAESAELPTVFRVPPDSVLDLNIGIFIAIGVAILMLIFINRTTFGFELRMLGMNPSAAQYAGVNVKRMTIMTMAISGALAGTAGAIQTLGIFMHYEGNQSLGLGFDSITVSLLASNHPIGTIFSGFLFGAMEQGATRMQRTGVRADLTLVIQALILMFIAAPQIIRYIYRVRVQDTLSQQLSSGWGKK
jgi:simple sugar transport system permease protein